MKASLSRSRKSAAINNSRWLAYATAGAATVFPAANSAEASIHYSGTISEWIGLYNQVQFPLDQSGGFIGFKHYRLFSGGYGGNARFAVAGRSSAAFAGAYHSCV